MDMYICTADLYIEAILDLKNGLNMASEPVTSLGDCTSRQKCKHSLYPGAQLLSGLVGISVYVPFKCATHIKVHQFEVRSVRRPELT